LSTAPSTIVPEPIASAPSPTLQIPEPIKADTLVATTPVKIPEPLVVESPSVSTTASVTSIASKEPVQKTEPLQTAAASPSIASPATEDKVVNSKTDSSTKKTKSAKIQFVDLSAAELLQMGITEQKILFDLNKSVLLNTDVEVLKKELELLQANADLAVNLVGYADARGPAGLNRELSLKRAITVKRFLMANGLEQKRILGIKGAGAVDFVNECSAGVECPDEKHMENRRVEIKFVRIIQQP
jgi:outer membrane protein OmpA-like peptidoglycan-associated protein